MHRNILVLVFCSAVPVFAQSCISRRTRPEVHNITSLNRW